MATWFSFGIGHRKNVVKDIFKSFTLSEWQQGLVSELDLANFKKFMWGNGKALEWKHVTDIEIFKKLRFL